MWARLSRRFRDVEPKHKVGWIVRTGLLVPMVDLTICSRQAYARFAFLCRWLIPFAMPNATSSLGPRAANVHRGQHVQGRPAGRSLFLELLADLYLPRLLPRRLGGSAAPSVLSLVGQISGWSAVSRGCNTLLLALCYSCNGHRLGHGDLMHFYLSRTVVQYVTIPVSLL